MISLNRFPVRTFFLIKEIVYEKKINCYNYMLYNDTHFMGCLAYEDK